MSYRFDAELARMVRILPQIDLGRLDAARTLADRMVAMRPAPDASGVTVTEYGVGSSDGERPVRVRLYRPARPGTLPALLNIHGGGFVTGSLEVDHDICLNLAREVEAVVVSVDYRLAPEYHAPAALDDCYSALAWLTDSARDLAIDPECIAVHGTSAGGGLAAGLALLCRDRRGPRLSFQFLDSPVLDDRMSTESMTTFTDTPMWNRPSAELSWRYYLGGEPATESASCYTAPARATDLTDLPPAYVCVMQFDPLRDEGVAYATALLSAGIPTELHLFPGTFHESSRLRHPAISRRQWQERVTVLRRALTSL